MPLERQPLVFVVSGPSGSGKSTLVQKLLELPGMLWSVSCTTRSPRAGDGPDGQWYNFVTEEEFRRMVARDEFLEHAQVFGKHWYGTPKKWLDEARRKGLDLVLEIDVQGARQVKTKLPASLAVFIFIVPPSRQELERRLRARGQDSEEEITRRLERARQELQSYGDYDYIVVNDDLQQAGHEVQAIALAARCLRGPNGEKVRQIMDSFGGSTPHDGFQRGTR
jgi:guanylate kinase